MCGKKAKCYQEKYYFRLHLKVMSLETYCFYFPSKVILNVLHLHLDFQRSSNGSRNPNESVTRL